MSEWQALGSATLLVPRPASEGSQVLVLPIFLLGQSNEDAQEQLLYKSKFCFLFCFDITLEKTLALSPHFILEFVPPGPGSPCRPGKSMDSMSQTETRVFNTGYDRLLSCTAFVDPSLLI